MRPEPTRPIRRDWIAKTLAGLLFGGVLAFACSSVFATLTTTLPLAVRGQLAMWLVPPVWLGVLGGVYFFASGRRAWLWLAGASSLLVALASVLQHS